MRKPTLVLLLAPLFATMTLAAQEIELVVPIDGVHGVDYFIASYFDHDPLDDATDYRCGWKTYDGATGTEFAFRNFPQMDSGITVLAAADGVVEWVEDGWFDRNKEYDRSNGWGNYIEIEHEGGWSTYYGGLRESSMLVEPGTRVKAGTSIALVGASTSYVGPYLLFDLVDSNFVAHDPFGGEECSERSSFWKEEPSYREDFKVVDFRLLDHLPSFGEFLEYSSDSPEFMAPDSVVTMWFQMENTYEEDIFAFLWENRDNGVSWFYWEGDPHPFSYSLYYTWGWLRLPPEGNYTATFLVNYEEVAWRNFTVGKVSGVDKREETGVGIAVRQVRGDRNAFSISALGNGIAENVSAQIVDIRGNLVAELLVNQQVSEPTTIRLTDYGIPSGPYILSVSHNGQVFSVPTMVYD